MTRNQLVEIEETEETESYIGIAGSLDAGTVAKSSKGKAAKRNTAAGELGAGAGTAALELGAVADGAERGGEAAGIGVQKRNSEIVMRGECGKFAPGHPPTPGAGRPPIDRTPDIRAAIWKRYTLEEIFSRLDTAYRIAVEMKSSRGIVAAVTPIMEYGLGKPIQQVVHEAGRTELLEQLFEAKDTPLLPAAGALLLPVASDEA